MPEGVNSHDFVQHIEEFGKFKAECAEKFGKYESDMRTLFRRVDKQDAILKSLEALNYNVGTLSQKMGSMEKDLNEMKLAPYKKWQKIGFEVLKYFILLLAGYLAAKIGLA